MAVAFDFFCKFGLYCVALFQIHILFFVGGRKASAQAYSPTSTTSRSTKSCPYHATKAFLGKCASIYSGTKIPFLEKVKSSRSLTMKESNQALFFLTAKPVILVSSPGEYL